MMEDKFHWDIFAVFSSIVFIARINVSIPIVDVEEHARHNWSNCFDMKKYNTEGFSDPNLTHQYFIRYERSTQKKSNYPLLG